MVVLGIRGECRSPNERVTSGETRFEKILQYIHEVKYKVIHRSKQNSDQLIDEVSFYAGQ